MGSGDLKIYEGWWHRERHRDLMTPLLRLTVPASWNICSREAETSWILDLETKAAAHYSPFERQLLACYWKLIKTVHHRRASNNSKARYQSCLGWCQRHWLERSSRRRCHLEKCMRPDRWGEPCVLEQAPHRATENALPGPPFPTLPVVQALWFFPNQDKAAAQFSDGSSFAWGPWYCLEIGSYVPYWERKKKKKTLKGESYKFGRTESW